jgi:hypothetical protein
MRQPASLGLARTVDGDETITGTASYHTTKLMIEL